MNKTEQIVRDIAEKQGIPLTKANEVMSLYTDLIAKTISNPDKTDENGLLDINKFKVIRVQHLGKFVPRPNAIKNINKARLKQKTDESR
jgi:hypothetical protein